MPEGPEIRRAADRVEKALVGAPVEVEAHWPAILTSAKAVDGRHVLRVDTRGKAMLTRFDGGRVLYSHNQLYGRWYVTRRGQPPRTSRSLRVALHGRSHSAYLYSATDVALLTEDELPTHPFLRKLGPDLLAPDTTAEAIAARLDERRFARRELAGLLLDQGFLAGLGNYLRAEILFVSGLHPSRRVDSLDASTRLLLAEEIHAITRRSYATGGITVDPRLDASLREEGLSRRARRHYVYGREGRPCRSCETIVERAVLGGRHVFYCPRCQG